MSEGWSTFTRLAEALHGVVALDEARRAGISDRLLRSWAEDGRVERCNAQVLRVPGSVNTWHQRVRVAVATEGPAAVASRQTAAVLHGLKGFRQGWCVAALQRGGLELPPSVLRRFAC